MDLEFGKCKLQVQVPERGNITQPRQLVGKEVVTSFEWLTERYFARLEAEEEGDRGGAVANGTGGIGESREDSTEPGRRKLRTEIDYVGGSVEIACSLGGADGVVDLVGASPLFFLISPISFFLPSPHPLTPINPNPPISTHLSHRSPFQLPPNPNPQPPPSHPTRIRRNHARRRPRPHSHPRLLHRRPPLQHPPLQPPPRRPHRLPDQRRHHRPALRPLPIQHPPKTAPRRHEDHAWTARAHGDGS